LKTGDEPNSRHTAAKYELTSDLSWAALFQLVLARLGSDRVIWKGRARRYFRILAVGVLVVCNRCLDAAREVKSESKCWRPFARTKQLRRAPSRRQDSLLCRRDTWHPRSVPLSLLPGKVWLVVGEKAAWHILLLGYASRYRLRIWSGEMPGSTSFKGCFWRAIQADKAVVFRRPQDRAAPPTKEKEWVESQTTACSICLNLRTTPPKSELKVLTDVQRSW
jgi:hypothetical protein